MSFDLTYGQNVIAFNTTSVSKLSYFYTNTAEMIRKLMQAPAGASGLNVSLQAPEGVQSLAS